MLKFSRLTNETAFYSMNKYALLCLALISLLFLTMCSTAPKQSKKPGPLARKVLSTQGNLGACQHLLNSNNIQYSVIGREQSGACTANDFVALNKSMYPYTEAPRATCPIIAGLALWEKEVVQKAADKHLSSPIAKIHSYRAFTCRNIAGQNRRSEHSYANAMDISGFTLKNGERITVEDDWGKRGPKGRFLRDVRNGSCEVFQMVLSPEYNSDHHDHFHFDMGSWRSCD